jgi:hypothetical protein
MVDSSEDLPQMAVDVELQFPDPGSQFHSHPGGVTDCFVLVQFRMFGAPWKSSMLSITICPIAKVGDNIYADSSKRSVRLAPIYTFPPVEDL